MFYRTNHGIKGKRKLVMQKAHFQRRILQVRNKSTRFGENLGQMPQRPRRPRRIQPARESRWREGDATPTALSVAVPNRRPNDGGGGTFHRFNREPPYPDYKSMCEAQAQTENTTQDTLTLDLHSSSPCFRFRLVGQARRSYKESLSP